MQASAASFSAPVSKELINVSWIYLNMPHETELSFSSRV
jgi:hypothetical protein